MDNKNIPTGLAPGDDAEALKVFEDKEARDSIDETYDMMQKAQGGTEEKSGETNEMLSVNTAESATESPVLGSNENEARNEKVKKENWIKKKIIVVSVVGFLAVSTVFGVSNLDKWVNKIKELVSPPTRNEQIEKLEQDKRLQGWNFGGKNDTGENNEVGVTEVLAGGTVWQIAEQYAKEFDIPVDEMMFIMKMLNPELDLGNVPSNQPVFVPGRDPSELEEKA
jgi:hypothetical protein